MPLDRGAGHIAFPDRALFQPLGPPVPDVKRIAVLRANALGDLIEALPALTALRTTYPRARIVLLGKPWHLRFLVGRPGPVDEVLAVPPIAGVSAEEADAGDKTGAEAFIQSIRRRRFDLALQLHGGGRHSNPFVHMLGAGLTAGMAAPGAPRLDRTMPYHVMHPEVLRLLQAVSLVGATGGAAIEPRLEVAAADEAEADEVLPRSDRPLAVLQPGATDPRRRWSPQRFAEVGDRLADMGACVAINGSADEAAITSTVAAFMHAPALDLAGRLTLGGLAALLARAKLLVSNDTGVAHLARAVGTPTTTIYWIGNLCTHGPQGAARHRVAVSWRMHCPICGACCIGAGCLHRESFVDDVTTEEVIALTDELCD